MRRRSGDGSSAKHHSTATAIRNVAAGPSLPTGYTAWWKADAITGVSDGAALTAWPDSSGNGHNLGQLVTPSNPTYYSSTAGKTVNGKPAVWFTLTSSNALVTSAFLLTKPMDILIVGKMTTPGATSGHSPVVPNATSVGTFSGLYWLSNGSGGLTPGSPAVDANLHQVTWRLAGASGTNLIRVDGTQAGSQTSTGTTQPGTQAVGVGGPSVGGQNWDGPLCEIVVYSNTTLTAAQIQTAEAYLKAKWGSP